jgi:hypothetical protein
MGNLIIDTLRLIILGRKNLGGLNLLDTQYALDFVKKPEGKKKFRRPRRIWDDDNNEIEFRELKRVLDSSVLE